MKISHRQAALEAIQNTMSQQVNKTEQTTPLKGVQPIENPVTQKLRKLIGQFRPGVINQPPVMRYGIRPPANDDNNAPPITVRYGIRPPANDDKNVPPPSIEEEKKK